MAGNSFGKILVLTTFGESHGLATGGILDGFPSNFPIDLHFIQSELNRRAPGSSELASPRKEQDRIEILSGVFDGRTTGAPVAFIIPNKDQKPGDYEHVKDLFRPSHGDYSWQQKYGHRDHRGGGRLSARETAARVAGGAFAKLFLRTKNVSVQAWVSEIAGCGMRDTRYEMRDTGYGMRDEKMEDGAWWLANNEVKQYLEKLKAEGDTAGGIISCRIDGLPAGLGEPVFDKMQARLAHAMMSINAVKGFDFGSGFSGAGMKGSEHNDSFYTAEDGSVKTRTNHSGGIQGGITNGMPVEFRVAFKPVSSIGRMQQTVDRELKQVSFEAGGRHDVCVVPRAVPIVEAMAALVLADLFLQKT
jgi:chorismate synthase